MWIPLIVDMWVMVCMTGSREASYHDVAYLDGACPWLLARSICTLWDVCESFIPCVCVCVSVCMCGLASLSYVASRNQFMAPLPKK